METNIAPKTQSIHESAPVSQSKDKVAFTNIGISVGKKNNCNRKQRFRLRRKQQGILHNMNTPTDWNKAIKTCGTGIASNQLDYTKVVGKDGHAHLPHTNTCGSWNCPYCSAVKSSAYGEKISKITNEHLEQGKQISFITLTAGFRANASDKYRLETLQKLFSKAKNSVRDRYKKKYGNFGYVRRIEFTINKEAGFTHYHLHVLFMFHDVISQLQQDEYSMNLILTWEKLVRKEGLKVVRDGQDYQPIKDERGISNYLAKTISLEMTSSNTKNGKGLNWFEFLERDDVFSKDKKERILRRVLDATLKKRLISFSPDLNVCHKEIEAREAELLGGEEKGKEYDYEIEMLTSCANVLLKLHVQDSFSFVDYNVYTEDVLELIHISPLYRMRFRNICNDTIEMRGKFDDDEVIDYFLSNLEMITLRSAVFPSMGSISPPPV